jgi:hypothetical protein
MIAIATGIHNHPIGFFSIHFSCRPGPAWMREPGYGNDAGRRPKKPSMTFLRNKRQNDQHKKITKKHPCQERKTFVVY